MAEGTGASQDRWRVVLFTNLPGGMAYRLVEDVLRPLGHRIVGVVTSPGPKRRRSPAYLDVVAAVSPGVDVIVSNHPERWAAMLAPLRPDLVISAGMPWKIPADVLALPRLGGINLHPALLPKYRGPGAVEWALRNGEAELGFTVHRLAPEFDTGAILAQGRVPIADEDDFETLIARLMPQVPDLLRQALERVARGDPGEPQDETQASYAGLFEDDWRVIDWSRPARTIHNQVLSWIAFRDIPPAALAPPDGQTVQITRTRLIAGEDVAGEPGPSGTILARDGDALVVQCGDGPIRVLAWSRPPVPVADPTPD